MGIDGINKVKGGAPTSPEATPSTNKGANPKTPMSTDVENLPVLNQPERATTHPMRPAPHAGPSLHEKELADIRRALTTRGKNQLIAAKRAMELVVSYRMRRSRAARRQAAELCETLAAEVDELRDVAVALQTILDAEADLHEGSADATLRALQSLVALIDGAAE